MTMRRRGAQGHKYDYHGIGTALRESDGKPPVEMGLGLNTEGAVSGNIGSSKRMDYTMIGDGVNLAARLESACKSYSARILISDFTYQRLKGTYQIRYIDDVIVKVKRHRLVYGKCSTITRKTRFQISWIT